MTLGPGAIKVEFMPGATWIDVSSKVALTRGVKIKPAAPEDVYRDVEPGNAVVAIYCDDGVWWPENPNSPYAGLIVEGMPVRITASIGATTGSVRHLGRVRLIEPELIGSVATGAAVTFTSTDVLADVAGITLQDRLSENLKAYAATATYTNGADAWDVWALGDDVASGMVTSSRHEGNDGTIVYPRTPAGTITFGAVDGLVTWGPLNLPNLVTFDPVGGVGPCLRLPVTAQTAGQIWLSFRTTEVQDATIASGYDGSGTLLWRFRQTIAGSLILQDASGATWWTWLTGTANDGQWHTATAYLPPTGLPSTQTSIEWFVDGAGSTPLPLVPSALRWITVGGQMAPLSPGKQTLCFTGDVSMLGVLGASAAGGYEIESTTYAKQPFDVFSAIMGYCRAFATIWAITPRVTSMGAANAPTQGVNALDALRTLARTVGGQLVVKPLSSGTVSKIDLYLAETPAPNLTPAFVVNLSNDDNGELPLTRGADTAPTRATVSGPLGVGTFVGDESTRRQDDPIDTYNVSPADAYAIAGGWVQRPRSSRITPITIDLATAIGGDTLAAAVLAMIPMVTVFTLGSMPGDLFGRTTQDQIVVSWEEVWGVSSVTVSIACLPAADWPSGVFDASTHGRFGADGCLTVTNGAALGIGTGAVSVASSTGDLMVTGSAISWDWNGECVTGTASGASSPQTLTISARAQQGTVARTHSNGDQIDVWQPATFGY